MKIGELARRVGVDTATIRFYEAVGVLPTPRRLPSGYRDYDPEDVARLRFVRQARGLGISLDDIRRVLALRDQGEPPCAHVRSLIAEEARRIDVRIAELERTRRELQRLAALAATLPETDSAQGCVCGIIDAATITRNPESRRRPPPGGTPRATARSGPGDGTASRDDEPKER